MESINVHFLIAIFVHFITVIDIYSLWVLLIRQRALCVLFVNFYGFLDICLGLKSITLGVPKIISLRVPGESLSFDVKSKLPIIGLCSHLEHSLPLVYAPGVGLTAIIVKYVMRNTDTTVISKAGMWFWNIVPL